MRLTVDEIRLITVILLILTVGAVVKHYRAKHAERAVPSVATPASAVGRE